MTNKRPQTTHCVVFDLDGTLLDTLATVAAAHNQALAEHGHPAQPVDAYRYFIGNGARKCAERSLPASARNDATIDAVTHSFQRIYDQAWRQDTQPYAGIPELLNQLDGAYALAVLSNKDDAFTRKIISHFFGDDLFDVVQGHSKDVPHKPDPTGMHYISEQLGMPIDALMIVGDTRVDMETAVAAGVRGIGATWGFREADELTAAGAASLINHPAELTALLA